MENKFYQLTETIENCDYAKVNFPIDENYVNCDLGVFEVTDNDEIFVIKYPSAVIEKSKLINYKEE